MEIKQDNVDQAATIQAVRQAMALANAALDRVEVYHDESRVVKGALAAGSGLVLMLHGQGYYGQDLADLQIELGQVSGRFHELRDRTITAWGGDQISFD